MLIAIITILGLVIGSAINAMVWRLHEHKSWVHGRSMCPDCGHELAAIDLVPVLSWLWLRGRCRYCRKPIHWQYPVVELVTAVTFSLSAAALVGGDAAAEVLSPLRWAGFVVWLVLLTMLIVLAVYDARWQLLPDKVLLPTIFVAGLITALTAIEVRGAGLMLLVWVLVTLLVVLLFRLELSSRYSDAYIAVAMVILTLCVAQLWRYAGARELFGPLLAGLLVGVVFYLLVLVTSGRAMGGGDIKLVFLMGLLLGLKGTALALLIGFNTAALYGIVLIVARRKRRRDTIAFGPFLVLGTLVAYLYGPGIISWYLHANGIA